MPTWTFVLLAAFTLWILASMKLGRPDGRFVRTHPYRRLMFFIMPTRTESQVFFERQVRADALVEYLERANERFHADVTHAVVAAASIGLNANPRLNRFVMGGRLYQRKGQWITFSMLRKQRDAKAKLSAVKVEMPPGETFQAFCGRVEQMINVERSGTRTAADREFELFNALPRPVLRAAVPLFRLLDAFNLLPGFFIRGDAMYTSVFVANLGSLGMAAGYHHLYEWGTCPFFVMVGRIEERPVVEEGRVVVRRMMPVRFTFDERIEDGINANAGIERFVEVLEDPARWLGCLDEAGGDAVPMYRTATP